MTTQEIIYLLIGGLMIAAGIGCYFKNSDKQAFPAVLVLLGVFLCAAQFVKADITGVGSVEMGKFAKQTSEAAEAVSEASGKNAEAIVAINKALTETQQAFDAYQREVNQRLAAMDAAPVRVPNAVQIKQSQRIAQRKIVEANSANAAASAKADVLRDLAPHSGADQ